MITSSAPPADEHDHLRRKFLVETYRMMLLIRYFEEQVRSLSQGGLVPGLVHLCAGQEATNAGTCMHLRKDDYIASHHRGHGHCLAKGARPHLLMAEILGRQTGYCGGRSGSMHIFDRENGNLGTNGIVGGGIPLAAGAALSAKARGTEQIAVAYFGDGALNQGLVPECMNMAAIWSLPVVFVCENNGFGEFTAIEDVTAGQSLLSRGQVYDIPSVEVDGMDVLAVSAAFVEARDRARRGGGPSFLLCNTYRFGGHHAGDRQDYKSEEDARLWRDRDPIPKLAMHLKAAEIASPAVLQDIEASVEEEIQAAVQFAKASPAPESLDLRVQLHG
ncbi:thiamine pyrophosphate-dependent dehydrogenase E1 component subunit alpha [Georhizobium sp. MAB10]|uniref:thiamine pyrophosphate-dependent dehydrogenase E1 component subunit alpha n=1 Tax=Georhizobium sp. MAB10 TaxID=3028319 RepID=UPI003855B5B4